MCEVYEWKNEQLVVFFPFFRNEEMRERVGKGKEEKMQEWDVFAFHSTQQKKGKIKDEMEKTRKCEA